MTASRRANRLIQETSPYLQQHAYNPVDWYPWGPEALERARREDKPIFLSIGYSTCHWCHVMAHESFENEEIAALMNQNFINIKVDREERPDLDDLYMTAVQLLTGRGGWPMSVFLFPDLKPFYAGTYFPPEDRGGLPGFPRLLLALSDAYRQKRDTVAKMADEVESRLQQLALMAGESREYTPIELSMAAARLKEDFDREHGGLGGAPKFPRALELGFLLTQYRSTGDREALEMVALSLEKMARGGIYDQVGGGFHRYTVDRAWVVPHFEKMLYDNALLVPLYLAHVQITGSPRSRRIARETLDFVLRELGSPQGGFYSAWDADSEGEEGKFYVWKAKEFEEALGTAAPLAAAGFGVTAAGNFEGKNILTLPLTEEELAARFSLTPDQAAQALQAARDRLFRVREGRIKPHRDEKIITAWNGLMLSALALGAQVLEDKKYYEAAARGARFLLTDLCRDGRLHRIWSGGRVAIPGFLDDYAGLANACLDLYETDFDPDWLAAALRLADQMDELFLDEADGTYFYVARDQEAALVRSKSVHDQAVPAGNSLAARVFWRLWRFTEKATPQTRFQAILSRFHNLAVENPWGFPHYLTVAALSLLPPLDVTLVGQPGDARTEALLGEVYRCFLPERRLVLKNPQNQAVLAELVPAVRDYAPVGAEPMAFVCHQFAGQPPTGNPGELAKKLRESQPGG
uniref:Thioredoxin domain-containing protein n=1 Tax=Desulfobacca acetoxidans TaxID=60893 RepID=A0A7C3V7G7_9BACT